MIETIFVAFGRFKLHPTDYRLYEDDRPVELGRPTARLLMALVQAAGRVLGKDELIQAAWGHTQAGDNLLHVHIGLLRKAIGHESIATKQGRGYRFTLPIHHGTFNATGVVARDDGVDSIPLGFLTPNRSGERTLIGRAQELKEIERLFASERLITLTGPGGVGKTRVMEAAGDSLSSYFSDGVWRVELSSIKDETLVGQTVAAILGIGIADNADFADVFGRNMASKCCLILLDNCEHVLAEACRIVSAIMSGTNMVKIVATSRAPLGCAGEHLLAISPLELPSESTADIRQIRGTSAVQLFVESASRANSDFQMPDRLMPLVGSICRRVDGLPLAIEIVASWASVLGVEALSAKLADALTRKQGERPGAQERHSTLRSAFQWGYELLNQADQIVLRQLAIFHDTFTLPAAECVVGGDYVARADIWNSLCRLVKRSMVTVVSLEAAPRYRLLETTRTFALEQLVEAGERDHCIDRLTSYVQKELAQSEKEWETTSDEAWEARYAPLLSDLRAVLGQPADDQNDVLKIIRVASFSGPVWRQLSLRREGLARLSASVDQLPFDAPSLVEAKLRYALADMLLSGTETKRAQRESEIAIALSRAEGEMLLLANALITFGYTHLMAGEADRARSILEEACEIFEIGGWLRGLGVALALLVRVHVQLKSFDLARAVGKRAELLYELSGAKRSALYLSAHLMEVSLEVGATRDAITRGRELVLQLRSTIHSGLLGAVLANLTGALITEGHYADAFRTAREASILLRECGMLFWLFDYLALLNALTGKPRTAALLTDYIDQVYLRSGNLRQPNERQAKRKTSMLLDSARSAGELEGIAGLGVLLTEGKALELALADADDDRASR